MTKIKSAASMQSGKLGHSRFGAVNLLAECAEHVLRDDIARVDQDEVRKIMVAARKLEPALVSMDKSASRVTCLAEMIKVIAYRLGHGEISEKESQQLSCVLNELSDLMNERGDELAAAIDTL